MAGRAKKRQRRYSGVNKISQYRPENIFSKFSARFNTTKEDIQNRILKLNIKTRGKRLYRKVLAFIERRPLTSFFSTLGILLLLIIIGSLLRRPPGEVKEKKPQKIVKIFSIGESPRLTFQAKVEKTGLVKIVAQTPGIVQFIDVVEGQEVEKGKILVGLASNYLGANAATLQRQLAAAGYQTTKTTFDSQKELLAKQREIAQKSDLNQDELNQITKDSLESTQTLLNLNERIVATLNEQQRNLESTNVGGVNDSALLGVRQLLAQMQAGTNQLRTSLQTGRYTTDEDNPPVQLSNLQKETALKQLDIQEKNLELSLEMARIQLALSAANEASFYPASPFPGTIERVHVSPGQSVNPGTELITLHGTQTSRIVAKIPDYIARNISPIEKSKIYLPTTVLQIWPSHISSEATDGNLYTAIFDLPQSYQNVISNNAFVTVDLPIGYPDTTAALPYLPLDAIYQTQDRSYVYINDNGTAKEKTLQIGEVLGSYVEVIQGLSKSDQVILDRTVVSGDKIKIM